MKRPFNTLHWDIASPVPGRLSHCLLSFIVFVHLVVRKIFMTWDWLRSREFAWLNFINIHDSAYPRLQLSIVMVSGHCEQPVNEDKMSTSVTIDELICTYFLHSSIFLLFGGMTSPNTNFSEFVKKKLDFDSFSRQAVALLCRKARLWKLSQVEEEKMFGWALLLTPTPFEVSFP